jgi:hypothetical protein
MAGNGSGAERSGVEDPGRPSPRLTPVTSAIEVVDHGVQLAFTFDDMLRYAGPGSPAGVALAYQAMRLTCPRLDPDRPVERREVTIETAFRGPGARDGFELVTRAVTEGRYLVTASLERPERGTALEQFVWRFRYRDRSATLVVAEGLVTEEFVSMARREERTPEDERLFTAMKQDLADRLLASRAEDVFEIVY